MHEMSIASEIHRQCRARLPAGVVARLERVRVRVGELSAVEPDLLRYAWQALVAGGSDDGAVLEVDDPPARLVCDLCQSQVERTRRIWLTRCPRCEGPLRVEGGTELDLLSFSYASPDRVESPA
jgi:hydrogenase nickel incorporation protein HypA/HybF